MKCPICDLDLSPLDLVSRTEHVDICIENGPSIVEVSETGQTVIKKNIAPGKERKICPICDKTFQNLNSHFQTCALKYDVPPDLMLEHWDKINKDLKNPKKFPKKLLDAFVAKCVKEGRLGDQVDFARALSISMSGEEGDTNDGFNTTTSTSTNQAVTIPQPETQTNQNADDSRTARDVNRVLMQNATSCGAQATSTKPSTTRRRFRIELADENTKQACIALRIERELSATRARRYHDALQAAEEQEDDCQILDDILEIGVNEDESNKLFHRARLKRCTGSECLEGKCENHELMLLMEEFEPYAGPAMDATPRRVDQIPAVHHKALGEGEYESLNEQAPCSSKSMGSTKG